ncbi:MAG: hypothetical protein G01um101438_320 [Parcubacteria group bacterium Gr01-1014_38]|nr:MAG: hypothetical protein G01um101438_320 [Parcubacteria group bacterium Gr01-1014_38]
MEASPHPPVSGLSSQDVENNRLVAALSWLWILSVVMLLVKKESPYVQFHARQSFLLFIVSLLLWLFLSFFGPLAWFLQWLLKAGVFVLIVIGFLQALQGRWWTLPVIGSFAPKVRL